MGYISEDYCSEELSGMLMEKGYIGTTNTYLGKDNIKVEQITLQSAMKWLRKVHKLHVDVDPSEGDWNPTVITLEDWTCAEKFGDNIPIQDTYEEACEAAIKYCLEKLI